MASAAAFTGRHVRIGGIYPFRLPVDAASIFAQDCGDFSTRSSDETRYRELRRRIFDPEKIWAEEARLLFAEINIRALRLSSGRDLPCPTMKIYIAAYPVGIGTIFFSMSLDDAILHEQEMIELLALVRGTVERIDPSHKTELAMEWKGGVVQLGSIFDVCRWVRQELMECYSVPETKAIGDIEFVYPILYVGEVGHCETATDIITRHSKSIAGLVNLWIADSQWLKHMEVQKVVEADIHPFEYGLTCVSSTSTVELHPTNLAKVAEAEGMALEDHHFQEMVFLACVCETPVAQLYALRLYDAELTEVLQQIGFSPVAIMNPLLLGQLFYRAVRLAILRRELARAVNQFRSIRFTRKAYMARTIKLYQAEFAIAALAADVDNKLGTIDGIVSSTFAMVTALLALFLSAMATVLAVVQGISALVDLGWI